MSLVLSGTSQSGAVDIVDETRECVRSATSATDILACERQSHRRWQAEVARLDQALRRQLTNRGTETEYQAAQTAWEQFRAAEFALIDRTLGARPDGLASPLAEGAKAQLLRSRAEQLAEHLSTLSEH